jgi:hypothetical protein
MKGLVLLAGVVACVFMATTASATEVSGLRGLVTRGPVTPVCRAEASCEKPAANAKLLFFRRGVQVSSTRASAKGLYRVTLGPGSYAVRVARTNGMSRKVEPGIVRVLRGSVARVDFSIDSGIR